MLDHFIIAGAIRIIEFFLGRPEFAEESLPGCFWGPSIDFHPRSHLKCWIIAPVALQPQNLKFSALLGTNPPLNLLIAPRAMGQETAEK